MTLTRGSFIGSFSFFLFPAEVQRCFRFRYIGTIPTNGHFFRVFNYLTLTNMKQCTTYSLECKRNCNGTCACENSYRPSNGTEGMIFEDKFCSNCIHDNPDPKHPKKCELIVAAMCFYPTEPGYPKEWVYDALGHPTCKNFVNWNWDTDGDPDDPENPKAPPPPPDPNQLDMFPLYPDERVKEKVIERGVEYKHNG